MTWRSLAKLSQLRVNGQLVTKYACKAMNAIACEFHVAQSLGC